MEREVREAYSNTNQCIAVPWRRMYRVGHARAKWLFRWISWEYHGCLGPIEHHGHIPREYHQSWFIYQCLMGQSSKIRHCPWLVSVCRVMSETKFEGWSGWWWTGYIGGHGKQRYISPTARWGSLDFNKGATPPSPLPLLSSSLLLRVLLPLQARCDCGHQRTRRSQQVPEAHRELWMQLGTPGPEHTPEECQNRCQTECEK